MMAVRARRHTQDPELNPGQQALLVLVYLR